MVGVVRAAVARAATARFTDAHHALLADPSLQFKMAFPPPPPAAPPWLRVMGEWLVWALRPVGSALGWIIGLMPDAPYARILLWTVIGAVAVAVAWTVVDRVRHGAWRWPRLFLQMRIVATPVGEPEEPALPEPRPEWLATADALAARGCFAEAVHLLLLRIVEDLARRRPGVVRPAATARELATAAALPSPVRLRVSVVAGLVERSLFGGRPVHAGEWDAARAAYADLARRGTWRA